MTDQALPAAVTGSVVTVGSYDGVHTGHREVLTEIGERARDRGLASILVTFEPHPLEVVNPASAPKLLTTGPERREILAQCELDYVAMLKFDESLARLDPRDFVVMLQKRFAMKELVVGYDHGFGRGRSGDVEVLAELGQQLGFAVDVVDAVKKGRLPVSSTAIRRAVAGGDLTTAAELLGRPYSLTGTVVSGAGRGRGLGYPTINVSVQDERKLLPPDGVYAVTVATRTTELAGMMNQGGRPTFGEDGRTLEANLFDFDGDLYGQTVRLTWVSRIRDVQAFESPEALTKQLEQDEKMARSALTHSLHSASH